MVEVKINGKLVTIWTSTPKIINAFKELEAERDKLQVEVFRTRSMAARLGRWAQENSVEYDGSLEIAAGEKETDELREILNGNDVLRRFDRTYAEVKEEVEKGKGGGQCLD